MRTTIVTFDDPIDKIMDGYLAVSFGIAETKNDSISKYLVRPKKHTLYKSVDDFGFNFVYMILPDRKDEAVLMIGPFSKVALSTRQTLELSEKHKISPQNQRAFNELLASVPVLQEESHLFLMLNTFCEIIWKGSSFSIEDGSLPGKNPASPLQTQTQSQTDNFDELMLEMKVMENRYAFENELLQAISTGQVLSENQFAPFGTEPQMEMRTTDKLRNAKNYCIILNTLARKAAENGGVHPFYLNKVSTKFAIKIEQLSSPNECLNFLKEMIYAYSRLVRKHSMNSYSMAIQKTILLIDSDLAMDFDLKSLAEKQGLSPGYLSTLFRKETGKTLSEYIRDKRIKHASHLLATTHLQVQTIALHCGIMDLQYFSKIFKRHTGKTPKDFRLDAKKRNKS
ncbi:MAG: helix-turn-helix transcriptional regulator [Clostridia bacterium]|nr:helix-turn-helix transcriptional regulator [Clostridia bacterium]